MAWTAQQINRMVVAIEVALGVLPITIVGGAYSVMGTVFGTFSVLASIQRHSYDGFILWAGVLLLALGGLTGITGLWLLVIIAWKQLDDRRFRRAALWAANIGVVTASIALVLAAGGRDFPPWTVIYLLVSPMAVVCHCAYASAARSRSVRV